MAMLMTIKVPRSQTRRKGLFDLRGKLSMDAGPINTIAQKILAHRGFPGQSVVLVCQPGDRSGECDSFGKVKVHADRETNLLCCHRGGLK